MKLAHLGTATAIALAAAAPAFAQYRQGQPQAAPYVAPATQASVANLDNRIVSLERQIADLLRAEEENGHRIAQLETQLKQQRDDSSARIAALEAQLANGVPAAPVQTAAIPETPKPSPGVSSASTKPTATNAVAPPSPHAGPSIFLGRMRLRKGAWGFAIRCAAPMSRGQRYNSRRPRLATGLRFVMDMPLENIVLSG